MNITELEQLLAHIAIITQTIATIETAVKAMLANLQDTGKNTSQAQATAALATGTGQKKI